MVQLPFKDFLETLYFLPFSSCRSRCFQSSLRKLTLTREKSEVSVCVVTQKVQRV